MLPKRLATGTFSPMLAAVAESFLTAFEIAFVDADCKNLDLSNPKSFAASLFAVTKSVTS